MSSIDLIRMTLKNLLRRKTRSLLTLVGVVIGTASIVIMLSIGIGMNEGFKNEVSRMGSLNNINVRADNMGMYGMGPEGGGAVNKKKPKLDDKAVARFSNIPGVEGVVPFFETFGKMVCGKNLSSMQIIGINPEKMELLNYKAETGRLLQKQDTLELLFGHEIQTSFYNPRATGMSMPPKIDVMKDKITLSLDSMYGEPRQEDDSGIKQPKPIVYKIKGIGMLEMGNNENDYCVFMSIDYLKKIIRDFNKGKKPSETVKLDAYSKVIVKVKDLKDVQTIQQQLKDEGYYTDSLKDILDSMQKTAAGIQMVLGAIGGVSLLVAFIGITNTMVMSIYERTREIGVMKVIGASLRDIKKLFLLESGLLGLFGGLVGIALSYGISYLINSTGLAVLNAGYPGEAVTKTSIIPFWLAGGALIFTSLVGLVSGYYPAHKAMHLSALEAIKKD